MHISDSSGFPTKQQGEDVTDVLNNTSKNIRLSQVLRIEELMQIIFKLNGNNIIYNS